MGMKLPVFVAIALTGLAVSGLLRAPLDDGQANEGAVIDVAAKTITDEMCIAAAEELARCAEIKGLSDERILPSMADWEIFPRVAAAVGLKAIEQGVARKSLTQAELVEHATKIIQRAQRQTKVLMREGVIAPMEQQCSARNEKGS